MRPDADSLAELLTASRYAGGDVLLAQGGGGNASVKSPDGRWLWVKASGVRLAEVTETTGYVAVERISETWRPAAADGPRPSMETGFHAALSQRVVLHTHAVYVNAFTCMEGGRGRLAEALGEDLPWVEYATPGPALAAGVARATAAKGAGVFVLANHGLIAAGATSAEVIAAHDRLIGAAKAYFGELPAGDVVRAEQARARHGVGPLVPDDVVYGLHDGRCVSGPRAAAMRDEQLLSNVLIRLLIARRGRPRELPAAEVERLSTMESEQYRRAVANQ